MKIAFIDEDIDQRETYALILQNCFPAENASITVVEIEPRRNLADMRFLVEDEEIVTIILDEQLKDSGEAQYFGIELASYLRAINKKIPIYILTSFPDSEELFDGEMTVEDILNKQELPTKKEVVGARILRGIDNYCDILGARENRFEFLLRKSVTDSLDENETEELSELGYLRNAPFAVSELITADKLKKLDELEQVINKLEQELAKKQ
ncbi:hypothetical protein [Pseudomonas sp. Pseusp16]|uniref:hypothetical protein n=1 Tax=Pseudomonas sp. Pseusp16 TaxID=3243021 RepID=UPI0039B47FA3